MSKYRITLEGKTYELEVETVSENEIEQPAFRREYKEFGAGSGDANINVMNPSAQRKTEKSTGAVVSPMPGTVLRIEKSVGDTVKAGELVLILEAMKMENEILSPTNGIITEICCTAGKTVAGGEVLFTLK